MGGWVGCRSHLSGARGRRAARPKSRGTPFLGTGRSLAGLRSEVGSGAGGGGQTGTAPPQAPRAQVRSLGFPLRALVSYGRVLKEGVTASLPCLISPLA